MAQFASNNFNTANGTLLSEYTGETGGAWAQHPNAGDTCVVRTNAIVTTNSSTAQGIYYQAATPGGADYDIDFVIAVRSVTTNVRALALARVVVDANTYYFAGYATDGAGAERWRVGKVVAGSETTLNETVEAAGIGSYSCRLEIHGTSLVLEVGGVTKASATDSAIADAGKVGVRSARSGSSTGAAIDSLVASDFAAPPSFTGTILSDGETLRCVWVLPAGSWGTVTVSSDPTDVAVDDDTVRVESYGTPSKSTTTNADDTLTMDVSLGGYVYTGETGVTVDVPAGLVTDGTNSNNAENDTAVTNNSTTDATAALTRQKARPVFLWAVPNKLPWTGAVARVAVAGGDNFAGTQKVTFEFFESDGTTPRSVTVGATSSDTHEANSSTWADLRGRGVYGEYWLVDVATSSLPAWSSASNDTVIKATATLNDGTTYVVAWNYSLRRWPSSPSLIYVSGAAADDSGDGSSGSPKKTIAGALAVVTDDHDGIVFATAGTYASGSSTWYSSDSRVKYLRWHLGAGLAKGDVIIDCATNSVVFGEFQWVESLSFDCADNVFCGTRTKADTTRSDYICLDNVSVLFDSINHPSDDDSPVNFSSSDDVSLIAYDQTSGFRGAIIAGERCIVQGYTIDDGGTGARNNGNYQLWERIIVLRGNTDTDFAAHPSAPVHTDGMHFDSAGTVVHDQIIRYCRVRDSAVAIGWLHNDGTKNLLFAFNDYWNSTDANILQLEADQEDSFFNIQVVNNTLLQSGAAGASTKGFLFSTNVNDSDYDGRDNLCFINNVVHSMTPATTVVDEALGSRRSEGNQSGAGYAWAGLVNPNTSDFENSSLSPGSGSALLGAGVAADFRYDAAGEILANDGTDDTGAYQAFAPSNAAFTSSGLVATITWTDNSDNETGFEVEYNLDGAGWSTDWPGAEDGSVAANGTSFVTPTLTAGTYQFRVRALGAAGNSDYSTTASGELTEEVTGTAIRYRDMGFGRLRNLGRLR